MHLGPLLNAFRPDRTLPPDSDPADPSDELAAVARRLGGVSLAGGLYRAFRAEDVQRWTETAHAAFPALADRTTVFAADWLGRLFAVDSGRRDDRGRALVLLLEPGTGEALELPVTIAGLHARELLEESDAALAASFYREWRTASGDAIPLREDECVEYRVPLFLGGADDVCNLERTDMEVYWTLLGQLHEQVAGVPEGSPVSRVALSDDT